MTREEALSQYDEIDRRTRSIRPYWEVRDIFIKIFDDFEELSGSKQLVDNHRTCDNCKHIEMTYNSTTDYKSYYCTKVFGISKVQLDFYCNRWEGKE